MILFIIHSKLELITTTMNLFNIYYLERSRVNDLFFNCEYNYFIVSKSLDDQNNSANVNIISEN